jgi:hypothetical protein
MPSPNSETGLDRRQFLRRSTTIGLGVMAGCSACPRMTPMFDPRSRPDFRPPVRQITRVPGFHWFGYYDKFQFDPGNRFVLGMKVPFHHRTPRPDDVIQIGMVDLERGDEWIELGESRAWGWQQGCMLQWRPGSRREVVWNDREDGRFVCRVFDVSSRNMRTLPHAIYTLSPDGATGLGVDFGRVQAMRPGYGYQGVADAFAAQRMPKGSGIYRVDLSSGDRSMVFSLDELVRRTDSEEKLREAKHYFNHLLFSPDGSRFIFLHRWRPKQKRFGFKTRMLTATPEGKDLHLLDPSGHTSHFIWRDPQHILAWTRRASNRDAFYLFKDRSDEVSFVGEGDMPRNGHCTYLPDTDWILNDTYPVGAERLQTVYLYHVPTRSKFVLGQFHSPKEFRGEWRCDTHPRASRDGRSVVIDSPHVGGGRQLHLIDIRGIVGP